MQTEVLINSVVVDMVNTTIGVRKINFDANQGFLLNDIQTKILGACNHQDFAGVGVAVPDALQPFRVAKMKSTGINGWRTAHNPPTPGQHTLVFIRFFMVVDQLQFSSTSLRVFSFHSFFSIFYFPHSHGTG